MATGLLPVLVGKVTRLAQYMLFGDKRYRATLELGTTTTTMDALGEVTEKRPVNIKEEELRAIIATFIGNIKQMPPMYSAKKVEGKRLYELARAGLEVEREPCDITIYSIDIIDISLPSVTIDVHSSAGTYIRVLASDIGEKAGSGAHLTALERTASGPFTLAMSTPLATLEEMGKAAFDKCLPMKNALYAMPQMTLSAEQYQKIIHGNFLRAEEVLAAFSQNPPAATNRALIYQEELAAIGALLLPLADLAAANPNDIALKPAAVLADYPG